MQKYLKTYSIGKYIKKLNFKMECVIITPVNRKD